MSAEVAALATQLGISHHAAEQLLNQLAGQGGVDSTSHAFAAIASDFHVSPARLAAALVAAKQSVANR
jgi:predicted ArsR family transcriptional regulator